VGVFSCPGFGSLVIVPPNDKLGEVIRPFVGPEDERKDGLEAGEVVGALTGTSVRFRFVNPNSLVAEVGNVVVSLTVYPCDFDPNGIVGAVSGIPLSPSSPRYPQANRFLYWH
jgi:hypothetical protein